MVIYRRLDELCELNMGQSPASSSYNEDEEGLPFFQGNADFGEIYPTVRIWCDAPTKVVEQGTLLISVRAPIGALNFASRRSCIGRGLAGITAKNGIELKYIYYCLKGKHSELNAKGTGSTFKAISKGALGETLVKFIPQAYQIEVINVLDRVSDIIAARKKQLNELDNLVKARFVEMFESCSCDTVKAGSLFQTIRNGVSPSIHGTYTAKVLTLSAITQGTFDESAWKNGMFDEPPADDKRVNKTDLYICRGNGNKALVGTAAYSKHDYPDLVFPDTIIAASVDTSKIRLPYLFYAWKHPTVRMQIESGARTTNGTFKVNQKTLSEIEVMLPPLELQEQFAAFVEQTDKSKVAVQKALDEAQMLFDSLMQKYFG